MERELIQLYEVAQKSADAAVDGGPEEDRCIDALYRLKEFPVNYRVLVLTQVGKRLRGLTKHNSNKIKVLAAQVVDIWKGIVVEETERNRKNKELKSGGSVKAEKEKSVKVESTGSNSVKVEYPESDEKVMKVDIVKTKRSATEQIKVEKRVKEETSSSWSPEPIKVESRIKEEKSSSHVIKPKKEPIGTPKLEEKSSSNVIKPKEERVDAPKLEEKSSSNFSKPKKEPVGTPKLNSVVYCKDAIRDKMREILAEALCKVSSEVDEDVRDQVDACDPYRVAVLVETAMFEKWGKSNGIQKAKYRSIMFNIKDANNPDFRRKVLLGEFAPDTITELTPEQMASEARQKQIEDIKQKALFDCERGLPPQASTDQFTCRRCKKKETTYYQMQTRSADEPMTTYVTCVNCGNRWKFC